MKVCNSHTPTVKVTAYILVKEVHAIKDTFWQKAASSHKEQTSPLMTVELF